MQPFQQFRVGDDLVETLAVCQDGDDPPYSRLDDIQETFPGSIRFKLDGVTLNFLTDEDGKKYEPKRIAHYQDQIIDVVLDDPSGIIHAKHQSFTDDSMVALSNLSIQTSDSVRSDALVPLSPSVVHPLAVLSSIATEISMIQTKIDRSTDDQSDHHMQLMQQLFQMVQQQNETLTQLAQAKEREEMMLEELAAAKERDEELHRMQQQTIDRLIVAQQRIEAILVQNHELHEYPIPRLFVILPDSYEKLDPRSFVKERFRLFFLCECGEDCTSDVAHGVSSDQLNNGALVTPIPVKNSIHLAKHEGYLLSRPTEFFDQYGPYVLGMLRILKHCLAVAAVVAPVVSQADSDLKDIADVVVSVSESAMEAVDLSINFLEQNLGGNAVADVMAGSATNTQKDDTFSGLVALEGADLRRLNSFLRTRDADKILGNLYRITTETGHVKWVCFDHYRQVYRETAMSSFLQCVESNGGTYDPHFGKVTITLNSTTAANDFFYRLSLHAPAVTGLKVTLNWLFGSADLVMLVDKVAQSNVQDMELDLQETMGQRPIVSLMRPGKGRYHSLLSLFSNTKLRRLIFTDVGLIGPRTSAFRLDHSPSFLQRLHFAGRLRAVDDHRMAEIILLSPQLVELILGSVFWSGEDMSRVDKVLGSLSQLQVLRRYRFFEGLWVNSTKKNAVPYGSVALREIVDIGMAYPTGPDGFLEDAIRRSAATLEVLITRNWTGTNPTLDMEHILGSASPLAMPSNRLPFTRMTHLDLTTRMPAASVEMMKSIIPRLALIHFAIGEDTYSLSSLVDLKFLKSLHLQDIRNVALDPLWDSDILSSAGCQIESLRIDATDLATVACENIFALPLKRLHVSELGASSMVTIFQQLNLLQLQVLAIFDYNYDWETEAVLAARSAEFTDGLEVQMGREPNEGLGDVFKAKSRDVQGSSERLAGGRVRFMSKGDLERKYFASVLPSSS
ncbi:hypothetical protein EC957_010421 [Mortierella hygrophila]|uniref:Uncharacterized protein n=1 Tax=Mortierella hygrophila TaxID=979708 RepID=A0A9P6EW49_9FUNG|nr:hypothetical protein EC957_010421 [Mortierella hygrophila]